MSQGIIKLTQRINQPNFCFPSSRSASAVVVTETLRCGICTIRRWCVSSRATQTALLVLTFRPTEANCGQGVWTTRFGRGTCEKDVSYNNMTLVPKSSRSATVRAENGSLSAWKIRTSKFCTARSRTSTSSTYMTLVSFHSSLRPVANGSFPRARTIC